MLLGFVRGLILDWCGKKPDPQEHLQFFRNGLLLANDEAEHGALLFLTACTALGIDPGLGVPNPGRAQYSVAAARLAEAFGTVQLGKVDKAGLNVKAEMRLGDYLAGYKKHQEAVRALTPAKRDALRMEVTKLGKVPPAMWQEVFRSLPRERMGSMGVRG